MAKSGDNKPSIIIKKKISGGHGGHHGGAWKVAYADFVTAMMAFFMVLWLMGSDEETKQAVQDYFVTGEEPAGSESLTRNGVLSGGDGSSRSEGSQGRYSEDWAVRKTASTSPVYLEEQETLTNLDKDYEGSSFSKDTTYEAKVMYKIPGGVRFKQKGHAIPSASESYLRSIVDAIREHDGAVVIEGRGDEKNDWSLGFLRASSVREKLIKDFNINPNKLIPTAAYQLDELGKIMAPVENEERMTTFILKRTR